MKQAAQKRLDLAMAVLALPFGRYQDLSEEERLACELVARGTSPKFIALRLNCSVRKAYDLVDRALVKISRKQDRLIRRDDLTSLLLDEISDALKGKE